jgi:hypothetical protein
MSFIIYLKRKKCGIRKSTYLFIIQVAFLFHLCLQASELDDGLILHEVKILFRATVITVTAFATTGATTPLIAAPLSVANRPVATVASCRQAANNSSIISALRKPN